MCCKSEIYKSIEKAIGCWQTFSPDVTFFFRIKMNIAVFQVREFFSDKGHELKENFKHRSESQFIFAAELILIP